MYQESYETLGQVLRYGVERQELFAQFILATIARMRTIGERWGRFFAARVSLDLRNGKVIHP